MTIKVQYKQIENKLTNTTWRQIAIQYENVQYYWNWIGYLGVEGKKKNIINLNKN